MKDKTPLDRAISIIMVEWGYTRKQAKGWLANEEYDWVRPKDPKPIKWPKGKSPWVEQYTTAYINLLPITRSEPPPAKSAP